ncbi:MAG: hypothetical protein M3Y62_08365 [Candidatus Dormibacteraeota bacterium]|nr:hypothetical protein [Candidatus Dormibacteraeota bacterium]
MERPQESTRATLNVVAFGRPRVSGPGKSSAGSQSPHSPNAPAFASLSPTEQAEIIAAAAEGDRNARSRLVTAHLSWVSAAVGEQPEDTLAPDDLYQEGLLGLVEAIAAFPGGTAQELEAFCRLQIAASIDRARNAEAAARQEAREAVESAEQYERAEIFLARELGRMPTDRELAAKLEWTEHRTGEMRPMVREARRRHDEEMVELLEVDYPEGDAGPGRATAADLEQS